jgi:RecA/RadA recombinase
MGYTMKTMSQNLPAQTYRHLLPLGEDMLDIFSMYNRDSRLVAQWVENCLNRTSWEMDIHTEASHTETFRHFYFESKNIQKTKGQQTFGFGFPLVLDKNSENIERSEIPNVFDTEGPSLTMPIFIWYLTIRPNPNRSDSWILGFEENGAIAVNEYFVKHCIEKYNIDFYDTLAKYAHERPLNSLSHNFKDFIKGIGKKLGFDDFNCEANLNECPISPLLQRQAAAGGISWSGAIGLFPHQDGSLMENTAQSVDFQNFTWTAEHTHEFAPLPEDAYQRETLRTVLRNKITAVEGSHGSGKTHLATNILMNALSNGQKAAVVANDLGSLKQIQNEFVKLGLGNLTFLLQDIYHDKNTLLDTLRNEQFGKTIDFKEDDFKIAMKQARRNLVKSDDSHDALSSPIFGNENFAEVVGHYMASQRQVGKELLANHLNSTDYTFDKVEYDALRLQLQQSEILYKNANTLKHPLSQLHPSVFQEKNSENGRNKTTDLLAQFIEKWKALHHRHIAINDAYTQRLMTYYETHFNDLRTQFRSMKEAYSDHQFQFGNDFEDNSFFKMSGLRAASFFSDRSKNVLSAKDEALNQYDNLEKIFNTRRHFVHNFLKKPDQKDFKKLQINLDSFELAIKGWRKIMPATVQEELQRLNSKTALYFDKNLAEEIKVLENDLENLLKETNQTHIYAEPLTHKMLTLPKRMLFIEETVEKLEETQLNMRDFDTFYSWQSHWLSLPEKSRKLVQACIKVKPQNWVTAFESWYFHNTLIAHYQSNTLVNDALMNLMNDAEDKLRLMLPNQIAYLWSEHKKAAIKALKLKNISIGQKDIDGYKLFFNKKNVEYAQNMYLKDILKKTINTLTEIFPVLLMTPQVASQVIEGDGKEFDIVVFDNAQNIDSEQVVPILKNTEGVVVLSEYAPNETQNPNVLSSKIKGNGAALVKLNHLHRPLSDTARRLNQTVFYPELEVALQYASAEQSVYIAHVIEGKWDAQTQSNEAEIVEVMHILEEIHATPFNTYPRIGIVCLNKKQRNALNNNILHIIQKKIQGWEKLEQMQRNGLGIFSLEEIAGLQFDVLVVSGTVHHLMDVTLSKKLLRKLVSSFTKKIYWVNSIPKSELTSSQSQTENETAFLLSNLLLLSDTIQQNDSALMQAQYEQHFEQLAAIYAKPKPAMDSVFVHEVIEGLSHFMEKEYLKSSYLIDNQSFALVITPKHEGQNPIIIRIDGKLSRGRYFNPSWERRTLKALEKMNLPVLSIWSYDWWRNPKDEAFKLAQLVFAIDRQLER